jgi:multiple antibiotic resistance protein
MSPLSFGALCFSSLFTVIDPIAAAPVFASVTHKMSREMARQVALRACLVALGVLVVFGASGAALFRLFGITIDAFRIGGGLVFLAVGLPMLVRPGHGHDDTAPDSSDPSIVPLGVPLIGGPGAITTIMLLMGQSSTALHTTALFVALALALMLTFIVLLLAPKLMSKLGNAGTQLITKVMGLIVLVIGVQFIVDGIKPIAIEILKSAR